MHPGLHSAPSPMLCDLPAVPGIAGAVKGPHAADYLASATLDGLQFGLPWLIACLQKTNPALEVNNIMSGWALCCSGIPSAPPWGSEFHVQREGSSGSSALGAIRHLVYVTRGGHMPCCLGDCDMGFFLSLTAAVMRAGRFWFFKAA